LTEERASLFGFDFSPSWPRHPAFESSRTPASSRWLSIFQKTSIRCVPSRGQERAGRTERQRYRKRERGEAQSPETFSIGVPLPIRPRRRRECRVSCNYSPMNFRLFRDLFRFSYREGPNSAKLSRGYPLAMSTRIRLPPQVRRGIPMTHRRRVDP